MGKTVFVTAPALADDGLKALNDAGLRTIFLPKGGEQHDVERILATEDIDAIISRTVPLSAAAIQTATNLKVITKHGVGVSNIDVTAATRRGIPVYVTPGPTHNRLQNSPSHSCSQRHAKWRGWTRSCARATGTVCRTESSFTAEPSDSSAQDASDRLSPRLPAAWE